MQIIANKARDNKLIQIKDYYSPSDFVLFDIETTGFAAAQTVIYLIGCGYYEDDELVIKQWFNEDGKSELEIITAFMDFISQYKYLINYNGNGFDIPYLEKKFEEYCLSYTFDNIESVDLYKIIRPYKDLLHLDNLKQKTLEHFLGINRLDKYSGGDLIKIYKEYLDKPEDKKEQLLLQHNFEDIEGLIYNCCLMSYQRFTEGEFTLSAMHVKNNKLQFNLLLDYSIPKRLSTGSNGVIITGYQNEATISVTIVEDELKFFFDNYKEYYYLPAEDRAIHKSVATYVDQSYREKAMKDNCYVRKSGYFITQLDNGIIHGYKKTYEDTETYIELIDSFLQDKDKLNEYVHYILGKMINL